MKLRPILLTLFLFFQIQTYSQKPTINQQKINTLLENYFQYERENIHVQFNKTTYVNNEYIAFKGYVVNKKSNLPNLNTTNVILVIYNSKQEIIEKQSLYTSNGTFTGGLILNDNYKSGKYYFHFYTNWMNNFNEDDSFMQMIEIVDINEPYNFNSKEPIWKTAKVTFFPEGGKIINGINNTIGINIVDCNNNGIEIKNAVILDSKLKEIYRFETNQMGNGVFYFIPDISESYTLKIKSEKLNISQPLPATNETGIAISYNNNLPEDLIAIAVKTNEKGLELYKKNKFNLLIHQNDKTIQKEFTFNEQEIQKTLFFDRKYLAEGVNVIRLIDENINEISERLIYNYIEKQSIEVDTISVTEDNIALKIKTDLKDANMSVSILPGETNSLNQKKSIQATFYLNAYLEKEINDNFSYFDLNNKNRKQDMELLMLNQTRNKFIWENIKNNPVKLNFNFKKGINIIGKLENEIEPRSKYEISLISLKSNIFEKKNINANGEFKFENFFAQDSTVILLQVNNERGIKKNAKIQTKIESNFNQFMLPISFENNQCPDDIVAKSNFTFTKKVDKKTVELSEVIIKNNFKKEVFKHQNDASLMASAYKIRDNEFGNVMNFISTKGFQTGIDQEENNAYIRDNRGGVNQASPEVYIDNQIIYDFNQLYTTYLNEIDEIYIDKTGSGIASPFASGVIQIYLKEATKNRFKNPECASLIITSGFTKNFVFKKAEFDNANEFNFFGTLNWIPNITKTNNPDLEIIVPKSNQSEIQIAIEGFTSDGQLISEIKKVTLKNLK